MGAKRKAKKAKKKARQKKLREEAAKVRQNLATQAKVEGGGADAVEVEELLCEGVAAMANVVKRFSRKELEREEAEDIFPQEAFANVIKEVKKKKQVAIPAEAEGEKPLPNRAKKERRRLTITEFKQLVERPDLVEEHDRNASDPRLLIFLKMQRNTIPVPAHWYLKRDKENINTLFSQQHTKTFFEN
eukprot:TRINITY_DN1039_c0_g1_i2.p1 TRINITY_DN1039_c0_g1~~TRINITY_DN1039_c0_g1_i2.p1  ORF type:complete len:201 (+),score=58.66 TRINITY_DN1039_c0_g1_i2:41-604(+)